MSSSSMRELHERAEVDCDFAQAILNLLSSKYPSSCCKHGNEKVVVREAMKQAAGKTAEQGTAKEIAEHGADRIFFACAAITFGALSSSLPAFHEGES